MDMNGKHGTKRDENLSDNNSTEFIESLPILGATILIIVVTVLLTISVYNIF